MEKVCKQVSPLRTTKKTKPISWLPSGEKKSMSKSRYGSLWNKKSSFPKTPKNQVWVHWRDYSHSVAVNRLENLTAVLSQQQPSRDQHLIKPLSKH